MSGSVPEGGAGLGTHVKNLIYNKLLYIETWAANPTKVTVLFKMLPIFTAPPEKDKYNIAAQDLWNSSYPVIFLCYFFHLCFLLMLIPQGIKYLVYSCYHVFRKHPII